ncbi:MAG: NUDIX domain-containing protein [Geodermatophilaceae bacterium]
MLRDGDGWVTCDLGHRHWGRHGAAGLLIRTAQSVVMQHRAPWSHHGGTWGLPGGARDSHETVSAAALREAAEEGASTRTRYGSPAYTPPTTAAGATPACWPNHARR